MRVPPFTNGNGELWVNCRSHTVVRSGGRCSWLFLAAPRCSCRAGEPPLLEQVWGAQGGLVPPRRSQAQQHVAKLTQQRASLRAALTSDSMHLCGF